VPVSAMDMRDIAALVLTLERESFGYNERGHAASKAVADLREMLETVYGPHWRETLWPR
jgi:hypothetical protein